MLSNRDIWHVLAEQYEAKFMDLDFYNDSYDELCSGLKPGARVLEVGCGPGNITRYILNRRPDLVLTATDIAPNMVGLARKNNPAAECLELDCRNIRDVSGTFDAIVSGFCLPYINQEECERFIADAATKLLPGGVIYLSCIEGKYQDSALQNSSDGLYAMFNYLYEESFLSSCFATNQLEATRSFRYPYLKSDGEQQIHLVLLGRK